VALAKAQEAADYWIEEHQEECMWRHALGHAKSSASAEDQQAYQEARDAVTSITPPQYKAIPDGGLAHATEERTHPLVDRKQAHR
jgi:hypothetical protein